MKIYKIFSATMASKLRKAGFWIIKTEPNMKKPWLDVFIFEDTPEFQATLSRLTAELQHERQQ